ncbi:hypothetical protein pdam_00011262, partial [Pocillopora damicornis]
MVRRRSPLVSALDFRCCRLTFDERIGCITRLNDFVPRSHRAVSLQVAPSLKDCKGSVRRSDGKRVRGIHGPFALVFMPVSARGFALFTQRDIGQFRKGL